MTLVMATLDPKPHRCVSCGDAFASIGRAKRHVDEEHGHGRIEFIPGTQIPTGGRGERSKPPSTGPLTVEEGGGPVPSESLARADGSPAASPASWHEAQRAAWIEGCLDRLHRRWPTIEISDTEAAELQELFDELDYEAANHLVHRALVICERRPGPKELRALRQESSRSIGRKRFDELRAALDRGRS